MVRRMMMAEADAVIVHCEAGRRELLARFPRTGPLFTIPLGNFGGVYPRTMTRDMARERLGLRPDQFAFLFLGNLAPYKGLERLVSVFKSDADRTDALFIAGNPLDTALAERLTLAIQDDPRIHLEARTISDDEMQVYLLAGDAFVAPFEEVLTSSSVLLGLSWGLPAVVPALGCLPELVGDDAGIVYIPGSDQALATSLHEIKERDLATLRAAASQTAAVLDWNTIGRRMADVYRACLHR
jgi:glycosyltransferase involved in cell wall biosynthesis